MKKIILIVALTLTSSGVFAAGDIRVLSKFDLEETRDRFVQALNEANVPVVDRKTLKKGSGGEEILFPSPVYGSNIGVCHKGLRKDAPLSTRIWKDANGKVWVSYDEPQAKINQFGVIECGHETDNVRRALSGFASTAAGD